MSDTHDLLALPQSNSSLLIRSDARSSLVARGRVDAKALVARRVDRVLRAVIANRKGEPRRIGTAQLPPPRLYGVIDRNGEYVVDPIYKGIQPFSEGMAACSTTVERQGYTSPLDALFDSDLGVWGYVNHDGQIILPPTFERVREFSEQLAAVATESKWGFIRKDGSWAIPPRYDGALSFRAGVARVRAGQKCGFINTSGEYVIEPSFDILFEFSEGLACAELNGKVGYIEPNGRFAIEPHYDQFRGSLRGATSFQYGSARIQIGEDDGIIDTKGNLLFQCADGESIEDLSHGFAIVHESGDNQEHGYYIDSRGKRILSESPDDSCELDADVLDAVEGFREGLGVVAASFLPWHHGELLPIRRHVERAGSSRLFGYVNSNGQLAISPQFASAKPFREGLAAVKPVESAGHGFIDRNGNLAIEPKFTRVRDFANGMAPIAERGGLEGKWGFVDQDGNAVIDCRFDWVENFQKVEV